MRHEAEVQTVQFQGQSLEGSAKQTDEMVRQGASALVCFEVGALVRRDKRPVQVQEDDKDEDEDLGAGSEARPKIPLRPFVQLRDLIPIHNVPPLSEIVGAFILILQVVGVLPYVHSEDRGAFNLGYIH